MDVNIESKRKKTFENEAALPSLPIPDINHTIALYTEVQRAALSEHDFNEYLKMLKEFKENSEDELCQNEFLDKFIKNPEKSVILDKNNLPRNWLTNFFDQKVYTSCRDPIYYLNYGGVGNDIILTDNLKSYWDFDYIANFVYKVCQFWMQLHKEEIQPQTFRGCNWSMQMYQRFFNSAQIPGEKTDKVQNLFFTESKMKEALIKGEKLDLSDIDHITLIINGEILCVKIRNDEGNIHSETWFRNMFESEVLKRYDKDSFRINREPNVLSADLMNRDVVYKFRQALTSEETKNLELIDSAAFNVVFDFNNPNNMVEYLQELITGNHNSRVYHKNYTILYFKGGTHGSYSCHSMCEGMMNLNCQYECDKIQPFSYEGKGKENLTENERNYEKYIKKLDFKIPESQIQNIKIGIEKYNNFANSLKGYCNYVKIGKNRLRPLKIHPSVIVQIATQLGYYRFHNKLPSTYQTAQLRQFFNARTETTRALTNETKEFIQLMEIENIEDDVEMNKKRKQAFIKAHMKLLRFGQECAEFKGCDRHLMALSSLDVKCRITEHYTYKLGGAGNFQLSTSTLGSQKENTTHMVGGCAPYRNDGYGVFNAYDNNQITLAIWWYEKLQGDDNINVYGTDGIKLFKEFEKGLYEILELLE